MVHKCETEGKSVVKKKIGRNTTSRQELKRDRKRGSNLEE